MKKEHYIQMETVPKKDMKSEPSAPPREENFPEYVTKDENGVLIVDQELKKKIESENKCSNT